MKRSKAILLLLILCCGSSLAHGNVREKLDSARSAYDREEYEKALQLYREVAKEYASPSLFYNMGNAAFRAEKLDKAVLYYQRARKRAPWDPDIKKNLELTRERTRDEFETVRSRGIGRAFEDFLVASPLGDWWTLSMILSCMSAASFLLIAASPPGRRMIGWTLMVLFLFLAALFYGAELGKGRVLEQEEGAVILSPSAQIKSSPKPRASTAFVLHEGTSVEIRKRKGEWTEIRTPDDQVGWVRNEEMASF